MGKPLKVDLFSVDLAE